MHVRPDRLAATSNATVAIADENGVALAAEPPPGISKALIAPPAAAGHGRRQLSAVTEQRVLRYPTMAMRVHSEPFHRTSSY